MDKNINLCIEHGYANTPEKTAIVFEGKKYSYREVYDNVNRLTNALLQLGIKKGSRIGVLMKNRPESIFIYYAASRIGAVFTAFDYGVSSENLLKMINTVSPEMMFTDGDCLNKCISVHHYIGSVRIFVSISKRHASYLYYPDLISHASGEYYISDAGGSDPTAILFSSGTTSRRRAVAFSHNDFINHIFNTNSMTFTDSRGTSIVSIPFWHILGFQVVTTVFYNSRTLVMSTDFNASEWLRLVKENGVNYTTISPAMLSAVLYDPMFDRSSVESIKSIQIGGDSASPSLVMDALKKFPPEAKFRNLYGLTETTFDIAALRNDDYDMECDDPDEKVKKLIHLSSIGTPMEQVQIIIADEEENELERGSIGEVLIHSARAMIGYVSEETHEIIPQNDYWFHSNDVGYMDSDGYIFLLGQRVYSLDGRMSSTESFYSPNFIVYPFEESEVRFNEMYREDLVFTGSNRDRMVTFRLDTFFKGLYSSRSINELISYYQENIVNFIPSSAFGIHIMPKEQEAGEPIVKWDMPLFDSLPLDTYDINISDDKEANEIAREMLEKCTSLSKYIETIKPEHLILTPLFSSKRTLMGILSFSRVDANWPFSPLEQSIIRIIAGNACIAVGNVLEFDSLRKENNILESIVSVLGIPVIATDKNGKTLYINQHVSQLAKKAYSEQVYGQITDIIKENTGKITEQQQKLRQIETVTVLDGKSVTVRTTLADLSPRVYISTITDKEKQMDFSFLKGILSEKEIEIVSLVARGYANTAIADTVHISVNTVKYHLKNIFQKMDVASRSQLLTKIYTLEYTVKK